MGYCMEQIDSDFMIKAENVKAALQAIKKLAGKETIKDGSGGHFSWVETSDFVKAKTLDKAMDAWRWEITGPEPEDPENDPAEFDAITFNGEKLGDDAILFNAIAPYVEKGSYIEMQGEDGSRWRWVFDGKKCKEVTAKISFDEDED